MKTQYNGERKRTKGHTTIYKTLLWKLKVGQQAHHQKPGVNSGTPEGYAVPGPHVAPVVLLLLEICIPWNLLFGFNKKLWIELYVAFLILISNDYSIPNGLVILRLSIP